MRRIGEATSRLLLAEALRRPIAVPATPALEVLGPELALRARGLLAAAANECIARLERSPARAWAFGPRDAVLQRAMFTHGAGRSAVTRGRRDE
jgi:hypothetical protein